jgi:hypothetical protein
VSISGTADLQLSPAEEVLAPLKVEQSNGGLSFTGGKFTVSVKGPNSFVGDQWETSGNFNCDDSSRLQVTTLGGAPAANNQWDVVKAGSVSGDKFGPTTWITHIYRHGFVGSNYHLSYVPGKVEGNIWRDTTVNNVQDAGESASVAWIATLYDAATNTSVATVSSSMGSTTYSFDIWDAKNYYVKIQIYGFFLVGCTKDVGGNDDADNDFGSWSGISLLTGVTDSFFASAGDDASWLNMDAGYR